jgi:hypothetical protein
MLLDHDTLVLNVLYHYAAATDAERADGAAWYPDAYGFAAELADRHDLSVDVTSAVVAVLSPQTEWSYNKRWAASVVHGFAATGLVPSGGGLSNSLRRAAIALTGDLSDVSRERGTQKVNRFWRSILGEDRIACVDRHAIRVALGDHDTGTDKLTDKRYGAVERAYVEAADELGLLSTEVQAVTWVAVRRMLRERVSADMATPV